MDIHDNPFHLLGASPHDDRQTIQNLADERNFDLEGDSAEQARSILIHPRKRLAAEIAWLPGLAAQNINHLMSRFENSSDVALTESNLHPIAQANLLARGLFSMNGKHSSSILAKWTVRISQVFESIDPDDLRVTINRDRSISRFPEVTDIDIIEQEVQSRREYYLAVVKNAFDTMPPSDLVSAMTNAVDLSTNNGKNQSPLLIGDLVEQYEIEAQDFFQVEEDNIETVCNMLKNALNSKSDDIKLEDMLLMYIIKNLETIVKNWDTVAQPIQVNAQSLGLTHEGSFQLAIKLRNLAIYMFNQHEKLIHARLMIDILQDVFAEVTKISEMTAEDSNTMDKIVGGVYHEYER